MEGQMHLGRHEEQFSANSFYDRYIGETTHGRIEWGIKKQNLCAAKFQLRCASSSRKFLGEPFFAKSRAFDLMHILRSRHIQEQSLEGLGLPFFFSHFLPMLYVRVQRTWLVALLLECMDVLRVLEGSGGSSQCRTCITVIRRWTHGFILVGNPCSQIKQTPCMLPL